MTRKDISDLYILNRFFSLSYVTILLYCPFGILLMLLRGILGIQVFIFGFILPNIPIVQTLLSKLLCAALGITINVENPHRKEDVGVYISNYVSPFDHLVVHSITGSVKPGKEVFNSLLSTAFGLRFFGSVSANFSVFKKNLLAAVSENVVPLHFQPENKQTNGKGILKFKTWPFELCHKVQPVCIEVCRPILGVKISTFDSSYWTDAVWYLMSPYTSYTLRFLPVIEKMSLTETEFAETVRQDVASGLKVELSTYSAADLLEWEKRMIEDMLRREREEMQRPNTSSSSPYSSETHRMAQQVKEVLPMVPYNTILKDLGKTRNVDQTITNILEGHVLYVPEAIQSISSPSLPTQTTPSSNFTTTTTTASSQQKQLQQDSLNTAARSFGKSAHERMLSFQERKQLLVDAARRRYIEKHGLNIVGSS